MSNNYVSAAFTVSLTADEAALLDEVIHAVAIVEEFNSTGERPTSAKTRIAFNNFSDAFRATFPPRNDEPFGSFIECFEDPNFISLECDLTISPAFDTNERFIAEFSGDQFSVSSVGTILAHVARSAQPFGFQYAFTADKMRPGEFGGGYVVIASGEARFRNSTQMLTDEIEACEDAEANGLVIGMHDTEEGLLFWSTTLGFGDLMNATVFTRKSAALADLPIAKSEPFWIALPPRP